MPQSPANNEAKFATQLARDRIPGLRLTCWLIAVAAVSFALVDPIFNASRVTELLITRAVLTTFVLTIIGLSYISAFQKAITIRASSYAATVACGHGVAVLTYLTGGSSSPYWSMILVTFFGTTLLLRLSLIEAVCLFSPTLFFYDGLLLWAGESISSVGFVVSNAGIILGAVISVTSASYMRTLARTEFTARESLNDANSDLQRLLGELAHEKEQSERLLLNILPEAIAHRLRNSSDIIADHYDAVTILFADLVGFTQYSENKSPLALIQTLNGIFSRFDGLSEKYGLEKIKTIGDAYLVAGGVPNLLEGHSDAVAHMAIDMLATVAEFNVKNNEHFELRIGIHTGPAVAGVIGQKKFIYDIWGDSVNTASRMESHGVAGKIQISDATRRHLTGKFTIEERGMISIKGKGDMMVYFLVA